MEHFQAALDPRKQELLEARFLGARVSRCHFIHIFYIFLHVSWGFHIPSNEQHVKLNWGDMEYHRTTR